ncbi:hypothetical protein BDV10DRAFT_193287 [Aspergillus recurvatus]
MGQTFCRFVKRVDALQHTLAKLNEQVLPPSPAFPPQGSERQEPRNRAMTETGRTADDWYKPARGEDVPAGPIGSMTTPIHDKAQGYEDGERLTCLFANDGVDCFRYPTIIRVRDIRQPQTVPQSLSEPQHMTGVPACRPLPPLPIMAPQPLLQTSPTAVKTKLTRTTVQEKPPSRSLSTPGTRRPRSLSWYEILGYASEPIPGPITWEESVEDGVCIEGTGPFWSAKGVSIEGYTDGRRASFLTSYERRDRSVTWETELKVFRQAHELERAKNEVEGLKERIKDLQTAGKMYRNDLIMATQDIDDLEEQWRRDNAELVAARGHITRLEMQWEKDHAELLVAREYIKELEETKVQCECSRKRKAKANEEDDARRRKSYDNFGAGQEGRWLVLFPFAP